MLGWLVVARLQATRYNEFPHRKLLLGTVESFIHSFINANIGSLLTPINGSVAVIVASADTSASMAAMLILPLC